MYKHIGIQRHTYMYEFLSERKGDKEKRYFHALTHHLCGCYSKDGLGHPQESRIQLCDWVINTWSIFSCLLDRLVGKWIANRIAGTPTGTQT